MKKIRTIVVGCGNMGTSHARSYHKSEGFDLAGVVDPDSSRREKHFSLRSSSQNNFELSGKSRRNYLGQNYRRNIEYGWGVEESLAPR